MGLDDELCRKAKKLYGWELTFAGEFKTSSQIEIKDWMRELEHPLVMIGKEEIKNQQTYGFISPHQDGLVYQPFAAVYPGREHDFQEDLLRAALLHLRKDSSEKTAEIIFPRSLGKFVRSYHLWLLNLDNQEIHNFLGGVVPIYQEGTLEGITAVLDRMKIENIPQD